MTEAITRRAFVGASAALGLPAWAGSLGASQASAQAKPFIVDAHCHIFSVLDLPIDGFLLAVAHGMGVPSFVSDQLTGVTRKLHRDLVDLARERSGGNGDALAYKDQIEREVHGHPDLVERLFKNVDIPAIASALEIATRTRGQIAEQLVSLYPDVSLFLPALVDYEYWTARRRKSKPLPPTVSLPAQLDAHAEVFESYNFAPGNRPWMHGYAPFNPLRWVMHEDGEDEIDPLDQVRRAIGLGKYECGLGFVGVKLYPPTGFVPLGNASIAELEDEDLGERLDEAMSELFQLCQDEDVPIISHASDGNAFAPGYEQRASPWGWLRALKEFPKLRLDLAHFGHDHGIEKDGSAIECVTWSEFIASKLMPAFDHVYADLGYSPLAGDAKYREVYKAYLRTRMLVGRRDGWSAERVVRERLMFGTDWWMVHQEEHHPRFLDCFRSVIAEYAAMWRSDAELQLRFFGGNALRFLGILDERGRIDATSKARARLARYYEGHTLPPWLSGPVVSAVPTSVTPSACGSGS